VKSVPTVGDLSTEGKPDFCEGKNVILSIPSVAGFTYSWRNEFRPINVFTNSYTATTSGKYQLEISNASGCSVKTFPVQVTVKPSPDKPDITDYNYTENKCPVDDPIRLEVTNAVEGYQYQWYKDGVKSVYDTLSYLEFYEQGIYKVVAGLDECLAESDAFPITLPAAPDKPLIYVQGKAVWYLACNNMKAWEYKWYCDSKLIEGAKEYFYVAGRKMGEYQVSISNEQECFTRSDIVTIPVPETTGTENTDPFEGIIIYPNPTNGFFTIEIDNNLFGELIIRIISEQGKVIRDIKLDKTTEHFSSEIDLSGQADGVYIVTFTLNNYSAVRKVILE
jgi:hypothetical protein